MCKLYRDGYLTIPFCLPETPCRNNAAPDGRENGTGNTERAASSDENARGPFAEKRTFVAGKKDVFLQAIGK